jgi:hypothetical protein
MTASAAPAAWRFGGDAPALVAGEEMCRGARLLAVDVADDEAVLAELDLRGRRPTKGRREAALAPNV